MHYYIRAIQMEQLQQQDLNADVQQISEEISNGEKKGTQVSSTGLTLPLPLFSPTSSLFLNDCG